MPYIPGIRRHSLDYREDSPQDSGEFNYVITSYIQKYIRNKGLSYKTINDILGALEGSKLEFYRRVAAPYEDTKKEENGDVYR